MYNFNFMLEDPEVTPAETAALTDAANAVSADIAAATIPADASNTQENADAPTNPDGTPKKLDEVDKLMNEYDQKEKNEIYLKSPEFKAIQQKKKNEEVAQEYQKAQEMREQLDQLDAEKAMGIKTLGKRQLNAALDDEYLQSLIQKFSKDGDKGIKVISKTSAYLAAAEAVEKWQGLTGAENQQYLKDHFEKLWKDQDIHSVNQIDVTEAYKLFQELS